MRPNTQRSIDFMGALRVLRTSGSFRHATQLAGKQVILTAFTLLLVTLAGLFAIDAQARMLGFLGTTVQSHATRIGQVFFVFIVLQLVYELLQWHRRSLQNRVSVLITDSLRRRIFEKFSQLTYAELQSVSSGDIAQLHASDASQLAGVWAEGLLAFLTTLVLTLGVSIFLIIKIGLPGGLFFLVLVLLVILARRFARQMAPALQKRAEHSAQRLAVIQEAVRSVFLVKALSAEKEFESRVQSFCLLEQDMKLLSNQISCRYVPVFASLRWFAWAMVLLWVVYAPALTEQKYDPQSLVALVFAVNWYSSLLQDSFLFVGTYLSFIQVGAVSAQRLDAFLDKPRTIVSLTAPERSQAPWAELGVQNVSVEYPTRVGQWALNDVSVCAKKGQLIVLVGPVGAGKSTLLRTLLGELKASEGLILRQEGLKIGYLSQDVILPSATLRDVLRFEFDNLPSEDPLLGYLLGQAEFARDLEAMPAGLETPIGERGVTLSGGQRLRVGLAQLSYFKDADVLLLDDPLAALDAGTAEALTTGLICGMWAEKTRVVSTHSRDLASKADWVVRLEDGRVLEQGPPDRVQLPN